jgi:hypothetical protein
MMIRREASVAAVLPASATLALGLPSVSQATPGICFSCWLSPATLDSLTGGESKAFSTRTRLASALRGALVSALPPPVIPDPWGVRTTTYHVGALVVLPWSALEAAASSAFVEREFVDAVGRAVDITVEDWASALTILSTNSR